MKKLLTIFLIFFGILFFIFAIEMRNISYTDRLLYHNVTNFTLFTEDKTEEEIIKHFYHIQEEYDCYVAKYISKNFDDVSIYSTDTTLDHKITLKHGSFPLQTNQYILNTSTNDTNQTGEFYYFTTNSSVSIHPIEDLKTLGSLNGIFYVKTTEALTVHQIIGYLNENLGVAEILSTFGTSSYLSFFGECLENSMPLLMIMLIVGIIFVLILIRYSISQCKTNAIMKLHGFSLFKILRYYCKQLFRIGFFSIAITSLFILLYVVCRFDLYNAPIFMLLNALFQVVILFFSLLLLTLAASIENRFYKKSDILNGKKPFAAVLFLQAWLKYFILIFAIFSFLLLRNEQVRIEKKLKQNEVWNQTQNIYGILARFITNDFVLKRELEIKSFDFYNELVEEVGVFLIRADNYLTLSDGRIIYEANFSEGSPLYSAAGKSITVNENYLKRHPVYTPEHVDATNELIYHPLVMNILVPNSLKEHENEIRNNFLKNFARRKINVPDIYNREMNRPLETLTIEQLSVHIIYVKDDILYFSYHPEIEIDNQNQILDPIVIVDIGNFDYSSYFSYLTHGCFFESLSMNPVDDLFLYTQKHQLSSVYDSVDPIYTIRAQEIQELNKKIQSLFFIELALIVGFLFSIYMFNACYYEQFKYPIYIKRLFGHSIMRINGKLFVGNVGLTACLLLFFPINNWMKLFIVFLDIFFMIVFNIRINTSSFQQIVKGEH